MSKKNFAIIGNWVYGMALSHLFWKKHALTVFWREIKHDGEFLIDEYGKWGTFYDVLIISITTKGLSDLLPKISEKVDAHTHVILAMKGLTSNGVLPIIECQKYLPTHRISILSGPGFAEEIMEEIPVHLVLATNDIQNIEYDDFLVDNLTLDFSEDIIGVSWCWVLKNIYAIGAGMASVKEGFDRSVYTQTAVTEMWLLLRAFGCDPDTAMSPAWKGDMWVCTTPHSRNFRYGAGDLTLKDQAEWYNAIIQCRTTINARLKESEGELIRSIMHAIA